MACDRQIRVVRILVCTDESQVMALSNRRQGASEQGNERLRNNACIGAPPCRGLRGLAPKCVCAYSPAGLHHLID